MSVDSLQRQLRGFARPLAKIMLIAFLGLLALELAKEFLWPDVSMWESHTITILFGTFAAGMAGYFAMHKHSALHEQVLAENEKYRNSEGELIRTKEWFRSLTEHGSDLITVIDPQGTILYNSPSIERVLGYRPIDRQGKSAFDLVHPEDIPGAKSIIQRAFQQLGSTHTIEMRVRGQDGVWRWFESTGKAILDNDGKLRGVINSRDITERKRIQEALQISEERLRLIARSTKDLLWDWDLAKNVLWWNESIQTALGYRAEDLEPGIESWHNRLHPDDRENIIATVHAKIDSGSNDWSGEYRFRLADGSYNHFLDRGYVIRDVSGKPIRMLGSMVDITERKRVEEKILALSKFPEENPQPILRVNSDSVLLYANKASQLLLERWGCAPGQKVPESLREDVALVLAEGKSREREEAVDKRTFTLLLVPVSELGYVNFYGNDITERKQLEESLHRTHRQQQAILDNIPDMAWLKDTGSRFIMANEALAKACGTNKEQMIGKTDFDFLPKQLAERYRADDRGVIQAGKRKTTQEPFVDKDGRSTWIETIKTPVRDDNGRIIGTVGIARDITEQKQTEKTIRESARRIQAIFEQAPLGIAVIDSHTGRFAEINEKYCKLVGYSAEEMLSTTFQNITHPEDLQGDLDNMKLLHEGRIHSFEMDKRYIRKDGSIIWVHLTVVPLWRGKEPTHAHIAIAEDITERKQAEQKITESREMLRTIVENIPLHVFWKDRECNYLGCNTLFARLAGVKDPSAIIDKNDFELSWGKNGALYQTDDRSVMETGIPKLDFVEPLPQPDGGLLWLRTSKVPLHDFEGRVFGMLGVFADITERKQIEDKLRLQTSALEATINGMVITDRNGTIVWTNPAFTALTGYSAGEALGQNPRLLKSGFQDPAFYAKLWSTITSGRSWHGEIVNKRKDGTFYTEEQTITPVRNTHGEITHFIAIKKDITERKQVELKTRQLSRLAALGQLIGGIAHELKNPLFILTGRIQMAREKLSHQEYAAVGSDLETIDEVGRRIKTIADRFMTIAKPVSPQQEQCSIPTVLHGVLEYLAHELMKSNITVATDFAPNLPEISSDPQQLHEVFLNLMRNALQAMAKAHGKGMLTVTARPAGVWVEVRVQDDGPGIAPEHRARLFEPFFTTKLEEQGTGLGLWIVRSNLMMLKGEVSCESEVGKGTTFIVRLPINEKTLESRQLSTTASL